MALLRSLNMVIITFLVHSFPLSCVLQSTALVGLLWQLPPVQQFWTLMININKLNSQNVKLSMFWKDLILSFGLATIMPLPKQLIFFQLLTILPNLTFFLTAYSMNNSDQSKIRVVIRKRPLNPKEIAKSQQDVVEVIDQNQVKVREHKLKVDLTKYIQQHSFKFDSAFGEQTTNRQLYENCVRPIIECAFLGARVTCFAYGQTGSGKTYTMNGDLEGNSPGIYYLGAEDIFSLRDSSYENISIAVSFYEIYCGKLFDLLNSREQLQAREDGKQNVNIVGLTVKPIENPIEFMETIAMGSAVRITSQNSTNVDSSRSHAILQISLMNKKKLYGKISFIDLAGCERGADTIDQNKQTKIDGAEINKSLLALKECIRALDQGKNHTPFRGSKLTMVLKDSFTGFCKTVMIGNVSPGSGSCENTLNTLRYADRVKELKKGGNQVQTREEQLARQLMLPRSKKNKHIIIHNEDDSDQQFVVNPSENRQVVPKKTKYLQFKQEEEESTQKNRQNHCKMIGNKKTDLVQRKSAANPHNPRSVAHSHISSTVPDKDNKIHRNKSLANKLNLKGVQKFGSKQADKRQEPITERKNFIQNKNGFSLNEKYHKITSENTKITKQSSLQAKQDYSYKLNRHARDHGDKENQEKMHKKRKMHTDFSEEQQRDWEIILTKFRKWKSTPQQFPEMSGNFEELVKMIMKEELELSDFHKKNILFGEEALTQSLKLYNEAQKEAKNNKQMMDYTKRLHAHLSNQVHSLVQLQTRIETYQYHLRQHENCEEKLLAATESFYNIKGEQEDCGLWDP